MPHAHRHGGITAYRFVSGDVANNSALRSNLGASSYGKMIRNPSLTAYHDPIANRRASGDPNLAADDTMLAKLYVVANVDQVIESRSVANFRVATRSAIDRAVRADLDIRTNRYSANLQHPEEAGRRRHEAKSLGSDRDVAANLRSITDQRMTDAAVGADPHAITQFYTTSNYSVMPNSASRSNFGPFFDDYAVSKLRPGTDGCGGMHNRGGGYRRYRRQRGVEEITGLSERETRIVDDDGSQSSRNPSKECMVRDYRCSLRSLECIGISVVGEDSEM